MRSGAHPYAGAVVLRAGRGVAVYGVGYRFQTEAVGMNEKHGITLTNPNARSLKTIIASAKRNKRVDAKTGLVLCDNCDTPASKSLSMGMSWTGCAPCFVGEADSFDASDLISIASRRRPAR